MESEKVKEIKKALECCSGLICPSYCPLSGYHSNDYKTLCRDKLVKDSLTLINELESENERLLEQRNKTYNIWVKDTEKLKDRIAELEKEIEENAFYAKGYAQGIKNTYEVVIPDKLKQFAERLKEKMGVREYMGVKYKQGVFSENDIDETLKEFVDEE